MPLRTLVGSLSLRQRLPQIEVAVAGASESALVIVLVLRVLQAPTEDDLAKLRRFAREFAVSLWLQPGGPDTAAPIEAGDADLLAIALPEFGLRLPFGPTDFTQVNHQINEVLVGRAVRLLAPQPSDRAADFFCGLGNFTLPLATRSAHVVGLEGSATLVRRASQTAQKLGLGERTGFVARNLFEWTLDDWQALHAAGPIDRVLVDPPREGALAVARALAATSQRPQRLVYVSCNPATLARDCAVLVREGGWQLRQAGIVNMFPHTAHVESIAVLEPAA